MKNIKLTEEEIKQEYEKFLLSEPDDSGMAGRNSYLSIFHTKYGKLIIRDTCPGNLGSPSYMACDLDMNIKMTEENKAIMAKYKGRIAEGYYTPEGYGFPTWTEQDYIEDGKHFKCFKQLKEDRPDLQFLAFKFIAEGQHKLFKTYKTE